MTTHTPRRKNITRTFIALLIIWVAQAAACLSNTIITSENQEDFGTILKAKMTLNQSTGRYIFMITFPPNDPLLTHVHNCTLLISTPNDPSSYELHAPLRLSTRTDGTKSAVFAIASHLIHKAYLKIEHQGDLGLESSQSKTVYIKVSTYLETTEQGEHVPPP